MKRLNKNELLPSQLKDVCSPDVFQFETTKEITETFDLIYGQDRGLKALGFGLDMDVKGYNLYIEGPSGVGKTMYTRKYLEKKAVKQKKPLDWCYIYNFEDPNEPVAVSFPAGQGKVFVENMESFVKDIRKDIKKTFNNEEFEKEKKIIKQEFDDKREKLLKKLNDKTMKQGFQVKSTENGVYMMPIYENKTINEEDFENLPEDVKIEYEQKSAEVQEMIFEALAEIKNIERESDKKIESWQSNVALMTVNMQINALKSNYKRNKKISTYLDGVKKDILKNIDSFLENENDEKQQEQMQNPMQKQEKNKPWLNYRVNLFVDNSKLEGAPVIMDTNYSYNNIFGRLEYENQYGMLKTDYTMLKPGLLHQANGGYIIFQVRDLIANPACYESLKKALRTKKIAIENMTEQKTSMVLISLKPEPIPLDLKVILVGSADMYYTLLTMDEDFKKLFKIKVEFEESAPKNKENITKLSRFIRSYCEQEDLLDLDKTAAARIVEFASKLAGDRGKISTQFNEIGQVIAESATWAKLAKSKVVTAEHVKKALDERIDRVRKYDEKYLEMIKEETLLIETEGYKVGQINGLTVITIGDYSFGKPAKITANTYMGKSGIVNIEREVEMSGSSHSKGVLILAGYLGEQFAQKMPLAVTGSICFEQLYGGVDGDSASSTEAYAMLSSLSDIPINQSLAVTGSVNQKGELQPIGGVNEKIEGFYQICKLRGFNGQQGVIIPKQNVRNLHLADEIIDSVKKGEFHIYAVSTIDEGIEILTGVPAGQKDGNGDFPHGTINYLAMEKLKKFSKLAENK